MANPIGRLPAYRVYLGYSFANSLFAQMVFTVSGIFAVREAGLNPLQLVLVGTALELSAFIFEVPTGVVADVYSRRLSIVIGIVLVGIGFLVWGAWPLFATILLAQVLWALGYTFTSGATEAWIADEIGEERAPQAFLRAAQMGQLGALAGIGAGVALGSVALPLPMLLGGVLMVVLGLVLALTMPEHGFSPVPRQDRTTWQAMGHTFAQGVREVRGRPVLITILVIAMISGAASESFDRLWEVHFLKDVTFPDVGLDTVAWFGIFNAGSLLLGIAGLELVRRRFDIGNPRVAVRLLLAATALLVLAVAAFGFATGFAAASGAFWTVRVLRRVRIPISTAWLNHGLDPRVRATVFSMSGQADAIGQIAFGPLFGALATLVSIRVGLVASGVVLAPALLLYSRALRQGPGVVERSLTAEPEEAAI